jgi:hypothetical protein
LVEAGKSLVAGGSIPWVAWMLRLGNIDNSTGHVPMALVGRNSSQSDNFPRALIVDSALTNSQYYSGYQPLNSQSISAVSR